MAHAACGAGGRFSRCRAAPVDTCQYCARAFCIEHTYFREGHEAVCARKRCRAKHDDLQAHYAYRERVRQRNNAGLCGEEDCEPHPRQECSLCLGLFCASHLSERNYPFRESGVVIDKPVSICARCWQRRKIWRR